MSHHLKEPIKTLGTNMLKYLKENAYKISEGQSPLVKYKDGAKRIELLFSITKDSVKIHKEIFIEGYTPEIKVVYVDLKEFKITCSALIASQKKMAMKQKDAKMQKAS